MGDEIAERRLNERHAQFFQRVLTHALRQGQRFVVRAVQIAVIAITHAGAVIIYVHDPALADEVDAILAAFDRGQTRCLNGSEGIAETLQ